MTENAYINHSSCDTAYDLSTESLFTSLFESWGTRIAALEHFEKEILTTRETMLTLDDARNVAHDVRASVSSADTCDSGSDPDDSPIMTCSSESHGLCCAPVERLVPIINPAVVVVHDDTRFVKDIESDDNASPGGGEDAEIKLRAQLEKIMQESTERKYRRVLIEEERRRTIDAARERRDAGRIISRAMKRWHEHRVSAIVVVQTHYRGWVARRFAASLRRKLRIVARIANTWRIKCALSRHIRAATHIQASWRMCIARRIFREAATRRARVQQKVEEIARRYLKRRERSRHERRATQIQRAWRTYARCKQLRMKTFAAMCIQRIWRGARARRSVSQYRRVLARRDSVAFALDSADESDFMDDDVELYDDVFSMAKNMPCATVAHVEPPKQSSQGSEQRRRIEERDVVGAQYYARRREQFIRAQKKRMRKADLKSNPNSRLARFQKTSSGSRAKM